MKLKINKMKCLAFIGVVGFGGALFLLFANLYIDGFGEYVATDYNSLQYNEVGLLLGTSKYAYGGRPNLYFLNRINAAAELYGTGKVKYILVSGDNSRVSYNEPQDMKEALIAAGVSAEDIYLDYAGFSTLDSVVRASKVFNIESLTVISQQFHCERAIYIARAHGIKAVGYAARDVSGALATRVKFREYLARAKAVIDIAIIGTEPRYYGDDPYKIGSYKEG
jgi:SanA protein